jgi:hypothetical protein
MVLLSWLSSVRAVLVQPILVQQYHCSGCHSENNSDHDSKAEAAKTPLSPGQLPS